MTQPARRASPLAVFRHRPFALVWTGQLVSTAGDALTALAAGVLVYRLTGSALSVGLMLMATSLPSLLLGLVGGVVADRADRKRLLVASCLCQGLFVALIPLLIPVNVVWLYLLVGLSSCARQFYAPAFESVLPELAPDDELAAANALMSVSTVGATAVGYAAAGLLAAQLSLSWVFLLDAATFVFAALCFLGVPVRPHAPAAEPPHFLRDLRAGLGYLYRHPALRALQGIGLGLGLIAGVINTLTLPFTLSVLGASKTVYGVLEGLSGVGYTAGGFALAALSHRLSERRWLALGTLGLGLASLLYALSDAVPLAFAAFALVGLFNAPAAVAIRTLFQRGTPAPLRGRVIGAYFVGVEGALVVGMGVGGLGDLVGIRTLLVLAALVTLLIGAFAAVSPSLQRDLTAFGTDGAGTAT